ncbi:hypothetical protein D9M70_576240 [compost metagenome]
MHKEEPIPNRLNNSWHFLLAVTDFVRHQAARLSAAVGLLLADARVLYEAAHLQLELVLVLVLVRAQKP